MVRSPFKWVWVQSGKANSYMSFLGDTTAILSFDLASWSFQLNSDPQFFSLFRSDLLPLTLS